MSKTQRQNLEASPSKLTVMPDASIPGVDPEGFYQTPNSMAIKAIRAKLTAADWALWSYLQMLDPHGDRMMDLPKVSDIAEAIQVSTRQIKRSLARLEELGLYFWEPVVIRGQNLAGKQAKELCQKKRESKFSDRQKMTDLSKSGQDCPDHDKFVQEMTNLSSIGQDCPDYEPKPAQHNASSAPQTIQTYSDFIETLSEGERENFLEFGLKKAKQLPTTPELPLKWIEANWEELRSQWEKTEPGRAAKSSQIDWTSHPNWPDWLDFMRSRGVPTFVALGEWLDRKTRREIADWASERNLIWGVES